MTRRPLLILLLPLVLLCAACKSGTAGRHSAIEPPTNDEIEGYYNRYATGDYAGYVGLMLSLDSMPAAYRQQMIDLHKQHARLHEAEVGHPVAWHVERVEAHDDGRMLNVFLAVTYDKEQRTELVMLPLVYDGQQWRLR